MTDEEKNLSQEEDTVAETLDEETVKEDVAAVEEDVSSEGVRLRGDPVDIISLGDVVEEKPRFDESTTTEAVAAAEETLPEVTEETKVEKTQILDSTFDVRRDSHISLVFIQELPCRTASRLKKRDHIQKRIIALLASLYLYRYWMMLLRNMLLMILRQSQERCSR